MFLSGYYTFINNTCIIAYTEDFRLLIHSILLNVLIQLTILLTFPQKNNFLFIFCEMLVLQLQCSLVHDLRPDLSLSPGGNVLKNN